ncbi:F-box protein SKIP2-like isoform X2 [Punica granatum]|uniref:F-box domain-containing protein n=2 Tax=Punica granatum TaxID=22663 RepID=A0A218W2Z2_PUNGR|nr:F-box protein SKIP2-like isoform X2 [Punica granatum]OWM67006.1 hypothetical protein CDL15_Pgr000458 [Punica granatum]PKI44603.1 hypothetical protein CRG98_034958 [Punica granatum]
MGQVPSSPSSSSPREIKPTPAAGAVSACRRDLTLCLPDECLASVFAFLPASDRNSCSLVCRRWRSVDARSRNRLSLAARSEISAALPGLLGRFSSVSALSLKCSRKLVSIDDRTLGLIPARLGCLRKLKLKGCVDVSDEGLSAFSLLCPPRLHKVSFTSCGFGGRGVMSLLCNCPSLRELTLKRLRKLDAQNTPLSMDAYCDEEKLTEKKRSGNLQLERLCLKDLHNARIFIPLIRSCKSLKALIVCRSSGNWDRVLVDSLQSEPRPTKISEIQMENVQMGNPGLVAISASCPSLDILYLSRIMDCTDDGLSSIANSCRKLRKLHVDAWTRFGARSIGDDGVAVLGAKCLNLQELVLMGIPVKVNSLNALASNCSSLERMALCNTDSIGDVEMEFIATKFLALKKLCIKNCPISAKGIEAVVAGCPNLIKLKVKRCRGISLERVSRLEAQRTSLVISVDSGSMAVVEGEGLAADQEDGAVRGEDGGGTGRRRTAAAPASVDTSTGIRRSSTTNVICSSRGALLLKSKFGRTSSRGSGSSAHAAAR